MMTKEQIIEQVLENTNWEAIQRMRDIYMIYEYKRTNSLFTADFLKETGREILTDLLSSHFGTQDEGFVSTACLKAYKEIEDGCTLYGIRFEVDYSDAVVYIEEDDSIFDDYFISTD